jgi:rubrerythrin
MESAFNAGEILEIACEIERNGGKFYRRAVDLVTSEDTKAVLRGLAEMEDDHESVFEAMRRDEDLVAQLVCAPDDLLTVYLKALAGSHIFNQELPMEFLVDGTSAENILEKAIQLEMDSIAYYHGVREKMTDRRQKRKISDIIHEEMDHVVILTDKLFELKTPKKS